MNTENYQKCIDFYGDVLGQKLIFEINCEAKKLTAFFSLGNVYLMVETGGAAHVGTKPIDTCPTKFRFSVSNRQAECLKLQKRVPI